MRLIESKFKTGFIFLLLLLIITLPTTAQVDLGGELKTTLISTIGKDGDISADLQESLDLELFLPEFAQTETKVQLQIFNPTQPGLTAGGRVALKKLYLRHSFADWNLTFGRQPISWSFGSLLNPVDYNLGAVAMNEETLGKYVDAVEAYVPVNWNSGLSFIAGFPEGFNSSLNKDEIKWGGRGRMGYHGYDLTVNYVKEPAREVQIPGSGTQEIPEVNRVGFTAKGDLGPIGIYGAIGYYQQGDNDTHSYLLGGDYSYYYNYGQKIGLQFEYLKINQNELANVLGLNPAAFPTATEKSVNLLLGNISYPIDDFSSISILPVVSLDDSSILISPGYQNLLPNNITLNINGVINFGALDTLFGPKEIVPGESPARGMLEMSLSYPF